MSIGCFWVLALGFVAVVVYAGLTIASEGGSYFEGPSDYAVFLIAVVIVVSFILWLLYKKGIIKTSTEKRIESSPELRIVMNHISANNTRAVSIDKNNICIYKTNESENCHLNYDEHGIKPPDKKAMLQIASYIGKFGFDGRYSVSEKYDEDYSPGSGQIIGFSPNEVGGFTARYDDGDTIRTFKGVEVYNKKIKDIKPEPPKDTRKKLF